MSLKKNLRIMVVDDTASSRSLLINALENIGFENIDWEKDGKSAFDTITKNPVHLVISDYNMPVMDGLTLLRNLRQFKLTQRISFILVTGTPTKQIIDAGVQLGMNNFLRKPFDLPGMRKCLEAVVGRIQ